MPLPPPESLDADGSGTRPGLAVEAFVCTAWIALGLDAGAEGADDPAPAEVAAFRRVRPDGGRRSAGACA